MPRIKYLESNDLEISAVTVSESTLAARVRRVLKRGRFQYQRIENSADLGTPDVDFATPRGVLGKLELKVTRRPKRDTTNVDLKLSVEQVAYINTWGKRAPVYVLARVGDVYVLLGAPVVNCPINDLLERALWHDTSLDRLASILTALSGHG